MAVLSTRVIELGAFVVVGEAIRFSPTAGEPPSENAIAKLWSRFNERMDTVPGRVGTHAFG
ncbi:MAG TPA: hypothetical protein VFK80_01395, partial [Limnochordia bacterium]|nr:hypothetical protein [Limnochordia bacterium]